MAIVGAPMETVDEPEQRVGFAHENVRRHGERIRLVVRHARRSRFIAGYVETDEWIVRRRALTSRFRLPRGEYGV